MLLAEHNGQFKNVKPLITRPDVDSSKFYYPYEIYQKGETDLELCWPDISIKYLPDYSNPCRFTCFIPVLNKYVGINNKGYMFESVDNINWTQSEHFSTAWCFSQGEAPVRPYNLIYDKDKDTLFATNYYRPHKGAVWKNISNPNMRYCSYFYTYIYPSILGTYVYLPDIKRHIVFGGGNGTQTSSNTSYAVYSDDGGVTWNEKQISASGSIAFYFKNKCYLYSGRSNTIWCSIDGETWESLTMLVKFNDNNNYSMYTRSLLGTRVHIINNSIFIMGGRDGMTWSVLTSIDGINWQLYDLSALLGNAQYSGTTYSETFKCFCTRYGGSSQNNDFYVSKDGINWKAKKLHKPSIQIRDRYIYTVSDNVFIAIEGIDDYSVLFYQLTLNRY